MRRYLSNIHIDLESIESSRSRQSTLADYSPVSGERKSGIPADVLMPVCSSGCCYMALEKLKYLRRPARKKLSE